MPLVDLISLIASLASLILAIIAIWLSIVFYQMSSAISDDIKDAAKGISANVERLEKLFDRLYSDTFSMVKDTVTDMRKHMWPADVSSASEAVAEAEKRADESIDRLRREMNETLVKILDRHAGTDQKLSSLSNEVGQVLDRAISKTREVELEAREQTLRERILSIIDRQQSPAELDAGDVVDELEDLGFNAVDIIREIAKMRGENILEFEGMLSSHSPIRRAVPSI